MSRIATHTQRVLGRRARLVPVLSTLAASSLALLPVIVTAPMMPPFGLLMLLAWRILRPELWPAWIALPLGLADDLITGQPLGSSMALWTIVFLAMDAVDTRLIWRDYLQDWLIATAAIVFCQLGGWMIAHYLGSGGEPRLMLPQLVLSILLFPPIARLCAMLDRWRLGR